MTTGATIAAIVGGLVAVNVAAAVVIVIAEAAEENRLKRVREANEAISQRYTCALELARNGIDPRKVVDVTAD